jgi:hypothetical protein
VGASLETKLGLEGARTGASFGERREEGGQVVRLDQVLEARRRGAPTGVFEPAPVAKDEHPVRVRGEHELGHRVRQRGVALLAPALIVLELALAGEPELLGLLADDGGAARQLEEDRDLAPERVGVDGLLEEVHRADGVAALGDARLAVGRGQEDDRDVPGTLAVPDEARGVVAVHARHLHVEQNHCQIVLAEDQRERALAAVRAQEVRSERLEDRSVVFEVRRVVVHQKYATGSGFRHQ